MNGNNDNEMPMSPGSNNRIRALAACYNATTNQSHIPLPQWKANLQANSEVIKWKNKFEEAEKKRKALLTQSQKCERELADLDRRYQQLHNDHNSVRRQLSEKEAKLAQLQSVSEKVYREYESLKNKHDVQSRVMQDAMKSASQWYMQNRELKRKSTVLVQKFLKEGPVNITELADETDTSSLTDNELENLMKTIKRLTDEVGQLQAELNSARLQEFEAQEQAMSSAAELEEERCRRIKAETELEELRTMKDNLNRVSRLVATEMTALRELCQHEKEEAMRMRSEADKAQKERNVLKHQSTLLLADVVGDEKVMLLLQEIEELQEKLEEREGEAQLELMEEKLRLAESELQCALQRAEHAEKRTSQLISKVNELEGEIEAKCCPPPPPPPPLPPPPLPPAMGPKLLCVSPARRNSVCSATDTGSETGNPVLDMANMLGIPRKPTAAAALPGGAIDDIINQIKGGKFTLKATEKQKEEKKEEPPAAVQEMLNILGTLKRRGKNTSHQSRWPPPADVAL
ncbi:hypothetical protein L9F63_022942 [Diploptera punctata]|uniref:Shootin-1 n=1 Tax=Diploptera punctata TaxID=6984 RepID=A0AAD8EAB0_DIPPU|nr:hypothetical protein L9F63_022942 [Diploptera punctata]